MKKTFTFWKSLFLLCALIVGSSSVWAETKQESVTGTDFSSSSASTTNTSIVFTSGSGTFSFESSTIKLNQNAKFTITASNDYKITSVVFHVTKSQTSILSSETDGYTATGTQAVGNYTFNAASGKEASTVKFKTGSGKQLQLDQITITLSKQDSYSITAVPNNDTWGTVSGTTTITATPEDGYRVVAGDDGYTVISGTATVVNNGDNTFTVTPTTDCTVQINFEAIPCYTVTFNAEGGSCGTTSLTESLGGQGVILPAATTSVAGWEFAGWAADAVDNTTTQPTLYKAGSTYYPTNDTELHAVYTLSETSSTFVRVTSTNQVEFAKSIVVVKNSDNYVLNHSKTASVAAPTESNNEITAPDNTIFTLSGNNTDGFVLTGANGTLSQSNLSTSSANDHVIDWSGSNNQWKIEENANATNTFALSNSTNVALEYYNGWKTEYNTSYNNRQYTAMKLYVPKSAYNSNPSAITVSTVAFGSKDPVTLYLEGKTTNTNTATVTGSSNPIKYSSSDANVATVSDAGVVTPIGVGTATITASVDAELGVSTSASDTYEVTVKNATTLAGIKAVATSSTAVDFTADLASDMVITYRNGTHAYLQNGNVAIYASCATDDWTAGKKFTGAISGKVRKYYNEYQITAIDQTPVAGGIVPEAIEVAITDLTTANYATYEGRKIAINGATVSTAMTSDATSGGQISVGTNTQSIYAPVKGITLTANEKGNFVGYISRYNNAIRYNMYDQSWFTKTHNPAVNQEISFTVDKYSIDEDKPAVTSFAGQDVTETTVKGAVTYSIKEGSDDIITSLDASTGAVVLNGARGTATIVATAAYAEETDGEGIITPYNAASAEYSVTVRPRYTVTFSVNGTETELREESFGAGITVPVNPAAIGEYTFQGWSSTTVATTDTKPSLASLTAGNNYKPSADETYYAVFAMQTIVPNVEQTSTITFKGSAVDSPYENNDATWSFSAVTFATTNSCGLLNQSIAVTPSVNVTSIKDVTIKKSGNTWANATRLTMVDAASNQIFQISKDNFSGNAYTCDLTSHQSNSYSFTSSGSAWIEYITLTYLAPALTYTGYRTSLSESVDITIPASGYLSYCYDNTLDFTSTDVKAYKAKIVEDKVVLTKVDVVPAKTGVVLYCETPDTYTVPVATTDDVVTDNEMVGVLDRTQVVWNPSEGVYNYILQQGEFKKATDGYLKANRAYLSTSYNVSAPGAKALTIVFNDATTGINGVEEIAPVTKTRKVVKNGRLVIETPNGEFTIDGAKIK